MPNQQEGPAPGYSTFGTPPVSTERSCEGASSNVTPGYAQPPGQTGQSAYLRQRTLATFGFTLTKDGVSRFASRSGRAEIESAITRYLHETDSRCELVGVVTRPPFLYAYVLGPLTNLQTTFFVAGQTLVLRTANREDQPPPRDDTLPFGDLGSALGIGAQFDGLTLAVHPRRLMLRAIEVFRASSEARLVQIIWDGHKLRIWTTWDTVKNIRRLPFSIMHIPCEYFNISGDLFSATPNTNRNIQRKMIVLSKLGHVDRASCGRRIKKISDDVSLGEMSFDSLATGACSGLVVACGLRNVLYKDMELSDEPLQEPSGSSSRTDQWVSFNLAGFSTKAPIEGGDLDGLHWCCFLDSTPPPVCATVTMDWLTDHYRLADNGDEVSTARESLATRCNVS